MDKYTKTLEDLAKRMAEELDLLYLGHPLVTEWEALEKAKAELTRVVPIKRVSLPIIENVIHRLRFGNVNISTTSSNKITGL